MKVRQNRQEVQDHRDRIYFFPLSRILLATPEGVSRVKFFFRNSSSFSSPGFSLIELLITLALILIMTVMLAGRGSRSRQQRDLSNCEKNLQTIYTAMTIYASDNRDIFPSVPAAQTSEFPLSLLVPRCTTVTEIFICPGAKDSALPEGEPFANRRISYAYYMGWTKNAPATAPLISDRQVDTNSKKLGQPVFSPDGKNTGNNHHKYGGKILFLNGEIKKSSPTAAFDLTYPTNITLLNPKP